MFWCMCFIFCTLSASDVYMPIISVKMTFDSNVKIKDNWNLSIWLMPPFFRCKWFIADFIGLPYLSRFSLGLKSHVLISHFTQPIEIYSITMRPSSHVLDASIKTPKEIPFCKQTGLYILHTKWGLVVRGHLEPLCMFTVTSKTNFMFFKQHPWLFTGLWRQYLVRHSTGVTDWVGVYVNLSPFKGWL